MLKVEYSSMAFTTENYQRRVEEALDFAAKKGFTFGVQLHNSIGRELFECLMNYKEEMKFSAHAPLFGSYFLNLAVEDYDFVRDEVAKTCKYLEMIDYKVLLFHGFFMTDKKLAMDMKNYRRIMRDNIDNDYCLDDSFTMKKSVFESSDFERYKENFKRNYKQLKDDFPDYTLALENDFVGVGSGLQRPEEIRELLDTVWFDTGHFWCSSLLYGFDFYETSISLFEQKGFEGVHLNHNLMTKDTDMRKLLDSHTHLYLDSSQNLDKLMRKLFKMGHEYYTLEINDADLKDLEIFISWLS